MVSSPSDKIVKSEAGGRATSEPCCNGNASDAPAVSTRMKRLKCCAERANHAPPTAMDLGSAPPMPATTQSCAYRSPKEHFRNERSSGSRSVTSKRHVKMYCSPQTNTESLASDFLMSAAQEVAQPAHFGLIVLKNSSPATSPRIPGKTS